MSMNRDLESESSSDPRLPPELEREILLYAIQNDITDLPSLFLVSKRIQAWYVHRSDLNQSLNRSSILPIVFKVVVVFQNRIFPPSFPFHQPTTYAAYGSHIQHLLICNSSTDSSRRTFKALSPVLYECLLQCPNLTDLALWCTQAQLTSLAGLTKLTHLTLDVDCLLELLPPLNSGKTTTTPAPALFPNVTHFNMLLKVSMTTPQCESFIRNLNHHFPSLTHLAHSQYLWEDTNNMLSLRDFTLEIFGNLKALALWRSDMGEAVSLDVRAQAEFAGQDTRIVALVIVWEKAWEEEAKGSESGIWRFVDRFLAERENERAMG